MTHFPTVPTPVTPIENERSLIVNMYDLICKQNKLGMLGDLIDQIFLLIKIFWFQNMDTDTFLVWIVEILIAVSCCELDLEQYSHIV